MIVENNKLYLEKKIFFDKKKAIEEIVKETDRKNVIFMRYNGEIVTMKLELAKYFYEKIEEAPNFDMKKHLSIDRIFHSFIYDGLFNNNKTCNYLLEKSTAFSRAKYPLIFMPDRLIIIGSVELYVTPELYAKIKTIFKNISEIAPVNITSTLLRRFRTLLKDPDFSVSKIYGFRNAFQYSNYLLNYDDLIMPVFKAIIKIKSSIKIYYIFKNTFESQYNLLDNKTYSSEKTTTLSLDQRIKTIKKEASEKIESDLQGQSAYLKKLSEKVNLKSLTHAYENFFLYDLDNVIKPTFTMELQKEFSIYGLISFSGETKKKKKN